MLFDFLSQMTFLFCGKVSQSLLEIVFTVEKSYYLSKNSATPEEVTGSLYFLQQLHSSSKTNDSLHGIVVKNMRDLLDLLVEKLIHADDKTCKAIQSVVKLIVLDFKSEDTSLLRYFMSFFLFFSSHYSSSLVCFTAWCDFPYKIFTVFFFL